MKPYLCLPAVIFLASLGQPLHARSESPEDFKAKALAEWNALMERINSVRGEMHAEFHSTGLHPTLDATRMRLQSTENNRYAYSRVGSRFEQELGDVDENGKVEALDHSLSLVNEEYGAELRRTRKGDGWHLSKLKMGDQGYHFTKAARFVLRWLVLCDGAVWVPEWIQRPSFVITRIEEIHEGANGELSRVHFRYDGSRQRAPEPPHSMLSDCTVSGYVDFDDRHSYRIMHYAAAFKRAESEEERKGDLVYEESAGIPMLKVITEEMPKVYLKDRGWASGKVVTTYQYRYDAPPSVEEFRLSHYQLPEPLGASPLPKSHAYLWIALAAVGSAFVAIFFSWMARRARKNRFAA